MCNCCQLAIPGRQEVLFPGCKVKLGRFQSQLWVIQFGWYSFGGNRPFCGWYMVAEDNPENIRPLQQPDLSDIYLIKS